MKPAKLRQRTVRERVLLQGTGVHSGDQIRLEIFPAPADHGITFVRTDQSSRELRATVDNIVDTTLATTLGVGTNGSSLRVATVEHLMAALWGLGIDNALLHIDGPEVPVLDGSARPFVEAIRAAGFEEQRRPKRFLVMRKEVVVSEGNRRAVIRPGRGLEVTCTVDFDHPLISTEPFEYTFSERSFAKDLAGARTFGFLRDVEALRARGLALGGSLENTIVIDGYRILNPEGLRYPDEFIRHKVLDALGDLALLGMPMLGRLRLERPGHSLNAKLVRAVLADETCYEIVEAPAVDAARAAPAFLFEPAESVA